MYSKNFDIKILQLCFPDLTMERFVNRVALVTGAASGIGASICSALVKHGMKVVGLDIDVDALTKHAQTINADSSNQGQMFQYRCDLTKESDIVSTFQKVKEEVGGVDVCVCSAGVGHKAPILDGKPDDFRHMWDVNVMGYVLCCQEAYKHMKERGVDDGHFILINSGAGHRIRAGTEAYTHFHFYCTTKHAVSAVAKGMHYELFMKKSNIRVTQISPGIVQTNFTHRMYPGDEHKVRPSTM